MPGSPAGEEPWVVLGAVEGICGGGKYVTANHANIKR